MRAVAVTVDAAIARSRLVFPGAHVDLVGTFRNVQASFSRVLVENVRVLSLEDQVDVETYQSQKGKGERSNDAVVTVEVTPEQSEIVALAAREGKLDLMLRNSMDEEKTKTSGAQTEQLLKAKLPGEGSATTQAKTPEPPRRVERPRARPNVEAPKVETKNSGGGIEVVRSSGGAR
jgi:pilus assembly protein CpaB